MRCTIGMVSPNSLVAIITYAGSLWWVRLINGNIYVYIMDMIKKFISMLLLCCFNLLAFQRNINDEEWLIGFAAFFV